VVRRFLPVRLLWRLPVFLVLRFLPPRFLCGAAVEGAAAAFLLRVAAPLFAAAARFFLLTRFLPDFFGAAAAVVAATVCFFLLRRFFLPTTCAVTVALTAPRRSFMAWAQAWAWL